MISEVKYFNVELTAAEVLEDYRLPLQQIAWGVFDGTEYVDTVDTSVELSVLDGVKDISKNKRDLTVTNAITGSEMVFANGGIAYTAITTTSYDYWWRANTTSAWAHYAYNGTIYTNGVATGSLPVTVTTTGFSGATGTMKGLRVYSEVKSARFFLDRYTKTRDSI
jgi:hypothetical protein